MSTHDDYDIDNQSGASLLTDLNSLLDALRSNSFNATQPAVFQDYQLWVDSSTNILKMRRPDTSIINICNIDTGEFFGVAATTNATTLDGYSVGTDANIANTVLARDANGAVTGDVASIRTITGDAGSLSPLGTPEYLLDSNNLTGSITAVEVTAGTKIIDSISPAYGFSVSDGINIFPLRWGTYTVEYICPSPSVGVFAVSRENDATVVNLDGVTTETTDVTIDATHTYIHIDFTGHPFSNIGLINLKIAEWGWDSEIDLYRPGTSEYFATY